MRKGSILVIVLVTLVFAAAALVAFLDKAGTDLLVESRVVVADRLRMDAYSALEVTLAVLEDFRQADGALHSPSEGWSDPLAWAGWTPGDGATVDVAFQDESGKAPLVRMDATTFVNIFETWQMTEADAQHLADVIMAWMRRDYVPTGAFTPDYEQSDLPYDAPQRPLRSYDELAAIDFAKDVLYDENGRPNALWWRFCDDFSIFNFRNSNINGANPDILAGLGQFSQNQQQNIANYLNGTGTTAVLTVLGKQWFNSAAALTGVVGGQGNPKLFTTTISALRILITVHDRAEQYRLSVVIAPPGGARTVQTTATDVRNGTSNSTSGETNASVGLGNTASQSNSSATSAQTAAASAGNVNLQYPDTILEIRENDEILTPPPPPPAQS